MNDDVKRFRQYLQDKHNLEQINQTKEMIDKEFENIQRSNIANNIEREEKSRDEED